MKHCGFILLETLICGLLMALFLLFLLQSYGSTLTVMSHSNILHQGLNLAESAAAGKTNTAEGYTVNQEAGDYKVIRIRYHEKDLLNIYRAP